MHNLWLYLVLLGGAMILYAITKKTTPTRPSEAVEPKAIMTMLESFLVDWEREHQGTVAALVKRIEALEASQASPIMLSDTSTGSDKYSRVLKLAALGQSPHDIAKSEDLGIGEVELVLALSRKGGAPNA